MCILEDLYQKAQLCVLAFRAEYEEYLETTSFFHEHHSGRFFVEIDFY